MTEEALDFYRKIERRRVDKRDCPPCRKRMIEDMRRMAGATADEDPKREEKDDGAKTDNRRGDDR